jgi:hypothetical protein
MRQIGPLYRLGGLQEMCPVKTTERGEGTDICSNPLPPPQSLRCLPGCNSVNPGDGRSTYLRTDGVKKKKFK